jgi:hypothetical protein
MTTVVNTTYQQNETTVAAQTEYARLGGLAAIGGALAMIIGAILYFSSGADLWAAVDGSDMAAYLTAAGGVKAQLVANLTFWIVGVLVLGTAWQAMIRLDGQRSVPARVAGVFAATAVPLVIVSYIAMMVLVVKIAPNTSPTSIALANVVGWVAIRADDLATALLVGFAPFFLALAGRKTWMPTWLARWGYLAGVVGLFSLVVLFIPGLSQLGFLIVPVGVGWMIAAGVVLLRRA